MSILVFVLVIAVLIILFYFIAKLIVNYVPKKFFPIISVVLLAISAYLGYLIYNSIAGDIKFNKEKTERFQNAVDGLKLIRDAELAYKNVKGDYTNDYNKLIEFIENGSSPITSVREMTKNVMDRGVARVVEYKVTDTIGYRKVIEDFKDRDYKNMMYVPGTQIKYDLKTGYIEKGVNKFKAPVFEAKVDKTLLLEGLSKDLIKRELSVVGVDQINGPTIIVGTLDDVKETGNWPPNYDTRKVSDQK